MEVLSNTTVEQLCYVHCNFCNTVLAVNVPCSSIHSLVTVRCGHCSNILSVNIGPSPPNISSQLPHQQSMRQQTISEDPSKVASIGSASSSSTVLEQENQSNKLPLIHPPEKRHRVPSAYNRFIKQEIQRIKGSNPEISHREAFSAAAKNWAHFPHIHFGK